MRGSSVLFGGESTGRRAQQQPHLLPIDFMPDPCALEPIHQVNLPPYSTWMCWNIGMITRWPTWGVSRSPREGESGRGQTRSPTAALTPGRAREAHSEESTVPREAHPAPEPRHLSTDTQTQAQSFQTEARPGLHPGPHVPAHRVQSGLNVLTAESALSHQQCR